MQFRLLKRFSKLEKTKRGSTVHLAAGAAARKGSLRPQRSAALNAKMGANGKGAVANRQRVQIKQQLNSSAKSKRLAAQMANRPSVQAALKIKKVTKQRTLCLNSSHLFNATILSNFVEEHQAAIGHCWEHSWRN